MTLRTRLAKNIVDKGENAGKQHFLLYPPCFLPSGRQILCFNSLPNNKFPHWFNLNVFADDRINLTKKLKFILVRVVNIVGKGVNTDYQHFLLFPQCFQKASHTGSLKVVIVW